MQEKSINYTFNTIKLICAIFVVFIHCKFPEEFGQVVDTIARIAVPFFFMCAGYYCYYEEDDLESKKMIKKIKKTAILLFVMLLLYFIWGCFFNVLARSGNIKSFLNGIFSLNGAFEFFCLNITHIGEPFWYLLALLYCYIIMFFLLKWKGIKIAVWMIPVLLFANIVLGEVLPLFGVNVPIGYFRNFLLTGLPFLLIGYFFRKNFFVIVKKKWHSYFWILFGVVLSILERFFLVKTELYLGTIISVVFLFDFAQKNTDIGKKYIASLGEKYSLYIYCTHWFAIQLIYIFAGRLGLADSLVWQLAMPVAVVVFSFGLSVGIFVFVSFAQKRIQSRKK